MHACMTQLFLLCAVHTALLGRSLVAQLLISLFYSRVSYHAKTGPPYLVLSALRNIWILLCPQSTMRGPPHHTTYHSLLCHQAFCEAVIPDIYIVQLVIFNKHHLSQNSPRSLCHPGIYKALEIIRSTNSH